MQTFLPFADFAASASVLDDARLGNQCYRECKTLLNGGWQHHPAALMWAEHPGALCIYALALVDEMERRTKPDGSSKWRPDVIERWRSYYQTRLRGLIDDLPPWLGDESLHASHRAALLFKDFDWYSRFGWSEAPAVPNDKGSLPYVWPVFKD